MNDIFIDDAFQTYVNGFEASQPILPLVHNLSFKEFLNTVDKGYLSPKYCKTFKKNVLYCFYGKPGYKVSTSTEVDGWDATFPVSLVFLAKEVLLRPKAVYPFDTGGYELYADVLSSEVATRDEFLLLGNIEETAARFVTPFFQNNYKYYLGQTNYPLPEPNGDSVKTIKGKLLAHAFLQLAMDGTRTKADQRKHIIELHYDEPISLAKYLHALVYPNECNISRDLLSIIANLEKNFGIYSIPYTGFTSMPKNDYIMAIMIEFKRYLQQQGMINSI